MTIVIQNQFWDLKVSALQFEVTLLFDGLGERLVIPFRAIKVFYDPSAHFGLQFRDAKATVSTSVKPATAPANTSIGS